MKLRYKEKSFDNEMKNSKLLLITDTYTDTIKELKNEYAKVVIVAMEEEVQSQLQKENIPYKTLDEYIDEKTRKKTVEDAILWMQAWSNKIIKDGKTFKELVAYRNTSLWWFGGGTTLYYDKVRDIIRYIDSLLPILNAEKPTEIVVMSNDKLFKKVISIIGATEGIPTLILEKQPGKSYKKIVIFTRYNNFIRYSKWVWRMFLILTISKTKALSNKFRIEKTERHKKNILILSFSSNIVDVFNIAKGQLEKNDFMIASLVEKLKEDKRYNVTVVEHHDMTDKVDVLPEKNLLRKPFESYVTLKSVLTVFKMLIAYRKLWKVLRTDKRFVDSLNYKNMPLYELLEAVFSYLFSKTFVGAVGFIEVMKRVIDVEKPDIIVAACEYGAYGRSAVVEGRLREIPTIGIQHGAFDPNNFDYRYIAHEITTDGRLDPNHCPIPDKTVVYGTYNKDILIGLCGFPEDSVVVTGQPRYDMLYHADTFYSKEKFLKKYKVNPDHKIVLWATACHGLSNEENIKNFNAVFRATQNLKDVALIIKQHPREGGRYTKMIEKYLDNYKITAVITPKSSDTYEQLYVCNVMLTKTSTVVVEAVALNTPVIILNLSGDSDIVDYVKEGVALGVYKEEDLQPVIEKLLEDDTELARNRRTYIEKDLYKIDGKASERVADLITQMIEESRREKDGK